VPYWKTFYHLIWTTKDRSPLIHPALEYRLYPYLIAKAQSLGCIVDAVNGHEDHIHLVISIPPKLAVADVIQRLKGSSSHDFLELSWQRGYGVFSLSQKQRRFAIDYVNRQKEHHAQQTTNPWLERCDDGDD